VTDESQTFETKLGFRLGYLSVIVSSLYLDGGSHCTVTMIPHNIHLHKIFAECQPVREFAIMLSTNSVAATFESTISLLSVIFKMVLL